jgi:PqqD family protein of HPr-rel-A system
VRTSKAVKWAVLANACLYWRSWDHEHIVYNSASGDTHLLDPITAQALQILQGEPMELSTLVSRVADILDIELDNELLVYLEATLSELRKLELVGNANS